MPHKRGLSVQDDTNVRTARLELRLSVQERKRIEANARLHGMSLSDFIRMRALADERFAQPVARLASTGHHHDPSYVLPSEHQGVTPKLYACPVCSRRFATAMRCPCSNRLAVVV